MRDSCASTVASLYQQRSRRHWNKSALPKRSHLLRVLTIPRIALSSLVRTCRAPPAEPGSKPQVRCSSREGRRSMGEWMHMDAPGRAIAASDFADRQGCTCAWSVGSSATTSSAQCSHKPGPNFRGFTRQPPKHDSLLLLTCASTALYLFNRPICSAAIALIALQHAPDPFALGLIEPRCPP